MSVDSGPEIRPIRGPEEFAEALQVRVLVFVAEQGGPLTDEPDARDDAARHWVVLEGGRIVGTARVYEPEPGVAKIGRVALLPEVRGRGWGALLMETLLAECRGEVILDAQVHVIPFYQRLGFAAEGDEFLDAGILHRRMRLCAGAANLAQ